MDPTIIKLLSNEDLLKFIALIAAVLTVIATFAVGIATAIAPMLGTSFIRWLDQGRAKRVVIEELEDIIRHCQENLRVIGLMDCSKGIPARMHFEKMKMFETSLIFDKSVARELPSLLRKKFIGIRLIVRNLNDELNDLIEYFYGPTFRSQDEITERIFYVERKFQIVVARLQADLAELRGKKASARPSWPGQIIYIRETSV